MKKVRLLSIDFWGPGVYKFSCPACQWDHIIYTNPQNPSPNKEKSCWGFNGDLESPTFSPSILFRVGKYVPGLTPEQIAYCEEMGRGTSRYNLICHSFVEEGFIRVLEDSTQNGGKTMELNIIKNENL